MPDTAKIQPALTAEEWAERHVVRERRGVDMGLWLHGGRNEILVAEHEQPEGATVSNPADLCAVIALANAALPDDDPRKITWDDVHTILASKSDRAIMPGEVDQGDVEIDRIAAKLAALLPPHE